jgi:outer membrane lipoprotein-sorting protein
LAFGESHKETEPAIRASLTYVTMAWRNKRQHIFGRLRLRLNRLPFLLVLLGSIATAGTAPKQPQTAGRLTVDGVLRMMDSSAKSFKSLTADLEYIKYTAVVKDTSTETGQLFVRRDQKMRIEIAQPDKRTILRSGESLYFYNPKLNRVEEYNLGKNHAMVDQYLLLGFGTKSEELRKSYEISLTGEEDLDQRKTVVLELTPKSENLRAQISKIQMWIDEASWLPLQQKFYESTGGDYFISHYTKIKENLKLGEPTFKPDWSKDATIVKPHA